MIFVLLSTKRKMSIVYTPMRKNELDPKEEFPHQKTRNVEYASEDQ